MSSRNFSRKLRVAKTVINMLKLNVKLSRVSASGSNSLFCSETFLRQVETIGESYMVSCGIPLRNPSHASEIAKMALTVRSTMFSFKVTEDLKSLIKILLRVVS